MALARILHIQVQPGLVESLDVVGLRRAFQKLASNNEIVSGLRFGTGNDNGEYYNFDLDTPRPAELWDQIRKHVFADVAFSDAFNRASMAICTGQNGWDDYLLIHHWDATEDLDEVPAI